MKKYILLIVTITTLNSFAQIGTPVKELPSTTVGKISPLGTFIAELSYSGNPSDEKDTTYTLRYRNYKYRHIDQIDNISFSGIDGTVNKLYDLFKSVFSDENRSNKDYAVTVTLGKDLISISNHREMGSTMLMFMKNDSYGLLTEKQVDKLFGKN